MNRAWRLLATGLLSFVALPGTAEACRLAARRDDHAAIDRLARAIIQRSTAIIDAEIVTTTGSDRIALLRPLRVLKGPALPVFRVLATTNCDIRFLRAGDRLRIVLSGGPDTFSAQSVDNGAGFATRRGAPRLNRALDALLGVPRPRGFVSPLG